MDIKNVANMFSNQVEEKIHWGSAYSLWEVCRYKVIGIPMLDLLLNYVQDSELKQLIQSGIDTVAIPHVEKLQKFMKEHNLTYPPLPQRNSIDDEQIGRTIKEFVRLAFNHEVHAFISTSKDNERNLIWSIMSDDRKIFDKIIDINRRKGWLLNPPNISGNQ